MYPHYVHLHIVVLVERPICFWKALVVLSLLFPKELEWGPQHGARNKHSLILEWRYKGLKN